MKSKIKKLILMSGLLIPLAVIQLSGGVHERTKLDLLVEVDWLRSNIESPRLVLVDFGRSEEDFLEGHIPGAIYYDRTNVWTEEDGIPGMLPPVPELVESLEKHGIGSNDKVLIYDSSNGLWASRLFWALEYLGHGDVHLLNGGLEAWVDAGLTLEGGKQAVEAKTFHPRVQPQLLASKDDILRDIGRPGFEVIDTRSYLEYTGADKRAERGGHIPGARHIEWSYNTIGGKILGESDLEELYREEGLEKNDAIVTHCQTGVRATHTYFVLRTLGYEDVKVYDGSWAEWGSDGATPIESGR